MKNPMSDTPVPHDDEVDLLELFGTLWEGKGKIFGAATIAAIVSIGISFLQPNSFGGSTPIYKAQHYVFAKYLSINELLKKNGFEYSINSEHVFRLFLSEFRDYKEVVEVLSGSAYVEELLLNVEKGEQKNTVVKLAKQFEIAPPDKEVTDWTMRFEWRDEEEAKLIFNHVVYKTLSNVRRRIASDIAEMTNAVAVRNKLLSEKLDVELSTLENAILFRNKKRLLFLKEQSLIAKELGIGKNTLDGNGLAQGKHGGVSLSVTSSEVPFYLRGYKAIDKEISLLSSRSKEDAFLIDPGYVAIKIKLASIQQDVSAQQIHALKEIITTDEPTDWIQYDLALSDVKSQRKPILHLVLAIILGGIIGSVYVLISKAVRNSRS